MVLKFLICIPVYNNPDTVGQVINDCLNVCSYPIVVVDDGSDVPVDSLIKINSRVFTLRHEKNEGKGKAILTAFNWAVAHGFTHVVTLDGDGQHRAQDIKTLVDKSIEKPWILVIGKRNLESPNVPGVSVFGRNFSNFWVHYQTGSGINDSQSGFRVYPLFHIQTLKFRHKRYDFEIEILIGALWKGIKVEEVPIEVIYLKPGERVSHFKKFSDNARISWLNTKLVVVSLLRRQHSASKLGWALGLGVAIGCTPFFGFHSIIAIALAFFFRLNLLVLLLGTQVALPPLAPLLAVASIKIGYRLFLNAPEPKIFPLTLHHAYSFFHAWLKGSLVLGPALGLMVGGIFYAVSTLLKNQSTLNWTGKSRGGRLGNWLIRQIAQKLGLRAAYFCLYFIVPYFYLFAPRARRSAHEYWRLQRPNAGPVQRRVLIMKQFYRFGQVLIDRIYQSHRTTQIFRSNAKGIEHISNSVQARQGILIIGAHVGGWDIAARYLEWHGVDSHFYPVQLEASGVTFEKNLNKDENAAVQKVLTNRSQNPILEIHAKLREGKPVGLMADRPVSKHFELVPFFGKLAAFDSTGFRIAATVGIPVIWSFGFKSDGLVYDFYASNPKRLVYEEGSDHQDQIRAWIKEFADFLEIHRRKYPLQWFNFFEFWSSPPSIADFDRFQGAPS
jgi:predicted LPLAT superfamily acyltransferase/glycosyltransferase involved in cell wall biosynthesis